MVRRNEIVGIVLGVLLLFVIHNLTVIALMFLSSYLPFFNRNYNFLFIPASIGLWQIVYAIPLILLMKRKQKWGLMKGVIICAVLTALLNGGCWIFLIVPR
ncbi:hypothetical protein PN499_20960 [Kamptonema animale CS-326]|jgi:putative effector of murein hydrolase LrgA (UPF0299 family)|uniref:hypothetical protein n=1 Tax=Kamptonema animale TaxID=92934 RepID=UPI00232B69FD|nr:hypothetical protein [Kamptonema animale]MDB9513670.1 hypothetical protein [Kamptonema animale CS-326]